MKIIVLIIALRSLSLFGQNVTQFEGEWFLESQLEIASDTGRQEVSTLIRDSVLVWPVIDRQSCLQTWNFKATGSFSKASICETSLLGNPMSGELTGGLMWRYEEGHLMIYSEGMDELGVVYSAKIEANKIVLVRRY